MVAKGTLLPCRTGESLGLFFWGMDYSIGCVVHRNLKPARIQARVPCWWRGQEEEKAIDGPVSVLQANDTTAAGLLILGAEVDKRTY
ncbi:chitin biosynthesis protein [Aspergillus tubingensis]|uniref:chitin biosynthesis protein n=1 Tax=Aspergillus tubingensis TaxID=5068 RepID=UPI00157A1B10|nr:chitin biosynthesis protein [Aspergillus tubingensis]GFN15516.1 chitin biosynthesis protein [Aspergillus tubingensis]